MHLGTYILLLFLKPTPILWGGYKKTIQKTGSLPLGWLKKIGPKLRDSGLKPAAHL